MLQGARVKIASIRSGWWRIYSSAGPGCGIASSYKLRFEYRLTGEWRKDAPEYTIENSGVMFHSQDPRTMLKEQDWPISRWHTV